ncbi:MAG TPA: hypothetical protein VLX92_09010, partial [Kofleriaceae bacterium]|nr:hypothetical protein [Kofleriaceae bacterium]
TPVAGATITVVDANSHSIDLITQQNGNFYTSTSIAYPVTLYASACPTVQMMTAPMTQGTGGCNQTGCHTAAATGRIHLP